MTASDRLSVPAAKLLALTGAAQMYTIRGQTHGEPESESGAG